MSSPLRSRTNKLSAFTEASTALACGRRGKACSPRGQSPDGARAPRRRTAFSRLLVCAGLSGHIYVDGKRYTEHRLAWFYTFGVFPSRLDHRNRNRADNRIANLRKATRNENKRNSKTHSNNQNGFKGAYQNGRRWGARVTHNGKRIHLGTFDTPRPLTKRITQKPENSSASLLATEKPHNLNGPPTGSENQSKCPTPPMEDAFLSRRHHTQFPTIYPANKALAAIQLSALHNPQHY